MDPAASSAARSAPAGPSASTGGTAAAQQPHQPGTETGTETRSGADHGTGHEAGHGSSSRYGATAGRVGRVRLRSDAAERVLRRAVELSDQDDQDLGGIDLAALLAAADELELPTDGVHRAFAEEQLGLLRPSERRSDRLLGPDQVVVARVVDGGPDEALDRIDAWMRLGRVLRRRRREGGRALYARRNDPVAFAQRSVRAVRGSERLARVRRLEVAVTPVTADRSLVVLRVDTSTSRFTAAAGGATVAASGAVTSAVAAVEWVPWAWFGVPVAAAGGLGVAVARRAWLADVDEDLESILDGVASGGTPVSVLDTVAARLAASAAQLRPGRSRDARRPPG